MAHRKREKYVQLLLDEHLPNAIVVWDQKGDRWDTGRRSMLAFSPQAKWHLVVQDDALPCENFLWNVRAALATLEHGPAAFYMGRTGRSARVTRASLMMARARGECWLPFEGPWWGVAVAVETADIPAMIAWGDQRPDIQNYDRRMARYFKSINKLCSYSIPSLVDHRHGHAHPSLIPGRTSLGRDALWAVPRVDGPWSSRTFNAPLLDPTPPQMRHMLGRDHGLR